jgi:hypothetical protein
VFVDGSAGAANSWLAYVGINGYFNGTTWASLGDGTNNGSGLIAADTGGHLEFFVVPNAGASTQTISNATMQASNLRMIINGSGNVGIGTATPGYTLDVNGQIHVATLAAASGTSICRNGNVLSSCSSSIRYKENVKDGTFGLKDVMLMRPVTFKWKGRDEKDF